MWEHRSLSYSGREGNTWTTLRDMWEHRSLSYRGREGNTWTPWRYVGASVTLPTVGKRETLGQLGGIYGSTGHSATGGEREDLDNFAEYVGAPVTLLQCARGKHLDTLAVCGSTGHSPCSGREGNTWTTWRDIWEHRSLRYRGREGNTWTT
jgi:hypothetical protein